MKLRKKFLILPCALLLATLCSGIGYANKHPACTGGGQHEFESRILQLNSEESEGQVENVCIICGYNYIEYLPKTGHQYGDWNVVEERLESGFRIEQRQCQECHRNEIRTVRIEPVIPDFEPAQEEESSINEMDVVLSSLLVGIWGYAAAVIWYNRLVLNWYKKECAKKRIKK